LKLGEIPAQGIVLVFVERDKALCDGAKLSCCRGKFPPDDFAEMTFNYAFHGSSLAAFMPCGDAKMSGNRPHPEPGGVRSTAC